MTDKEFKVISIKDFIKFDVSRFYEPGFEEELKYMGNLTAYVFSAINETHLTQAKAPNQWDVWFNHPTFTLRNFLPESATGKINPLHKKENDFLALYEGFCKTFVSAYDKSYKEFSKDNTAFYTANLCKTKLSRAFGSLVKDDGQLDLAPIVKAGFIDLRLPILYSVDFLTGKLVKNEFSEEMRDLYDSLNSTMTKTVQNIGIIKEKTKK